MERESMEFDVVVVGAGPAGLSAAIKLGQLAQEQEQEVSICVVEKGSEVGAHILSGAVFETSALDELLPDWRSMGSPLTTEVKEDVFYYYTSGKSAFQIPNLFLPAPVHNDGNYIVSMGNVCRWLAEQAENMGIEVYPGFAAAEVLFNADGSVKGVATGDMGISAEGEQKDSTCPVWSYMPSTRSSRKAVAVTSVNSSSRILVSTKERPSTLRDWYQRGLANQPEFTRKAKSSRLGWPLAESGSSGGAFMYHAENNEVYLGLITDLNYSNPHVSPFEEFQRWKTHPKTAKYLEGAERLAYGARALAKGGLNSLPKMNFPGGLIIGCDAGTLNAVKIKGNHTAMKSGILAAEEVAAALMSESPAADLVNFEARLAPRGLVRSLSRAETLPATCTHLGHCLVPPLSGSIKPSCAAICLLRCVTKRLIMPVSSLRHSLKRLTIRSLITCSPSTVYLPCFCRIRTMKRTNPATCS